MINGFEWDANKARINQQKHGVSFEEAVSVFRDEMGLLIADNEHSYVEERFVLMGMSDTLRVLVVVHCQRLANIRIISARRATAREQQQYERQFL